MDTDSMIESKHGWEKDFDANCANFREGVRGWMGYLPYVRRTQLAGEPPALRAEMKSAKKPMKTQKLNQIKPD